MKQTKDQERAEELLALLKLSDTDRYEVCAYTGWEAGQFRAAVQALRDMFAATGDTITVTAEPQGWRQPWLYGLRDGSQMHAEHSQWVGNRVGDAVRRLKTMSNVTTVAVNATDGRTAEGKVLRVINLHVKRALEDIFLL